MKKLASLIVLAALLWSASAYAVPAYALVRTFTSAPADPNPNTTPPAAGTTFQAAKNCSTIFGKHESCAGFLLEMDHSAGGALTCDLQPWIFNPDPPGGGAPFWSVTLGVGGAEARKEYIEAGIGRPFVFIQVTNCAGATIDGGNPLRVFWKGITR